LLEQPLLRDGHVSTLRTRKRPIAKENDMLLRVVAAGAPQVAQMPHQLFASLRARWRGRVGLPAKAQTRACKKCIRVSVQEGLKLPLKQTIETLGLKHEIPFSIDFDTNDDGTYTISGMESMIRN
jgi:hypothetical protein